MSLALPDFKEIVGFSTEAVAFIPIFQQAIPEIALVQLSAL